MNLKIQQIWKYLLQICYVFNEIWFSEESYIGKEDFQ